MEAPEFNAHDRIHLLMSIPAKPAVSFVMGFLKGKLSLRSFQIYEKLGKSYWGRHLWTRGYCVSMVGLNEQQVKEYVKWPEKEEKRDRMKATKHIQIADSNEGDLSGLT
ncbi:MAG: transposase [Thermodesulfobacteriota bacterium]